MKLRVFTDGACSGNPGPGGWAAVFNKDDGYIVLDGYEFDTTNNRMELMAVVKTLQAVLKNKVEGFNLDFKKDKVEIHSDSAYVVNAVNDKWMNKWRLNGWKTAKGQDVKNKDLWQELIEQLRMCKAIGLNVHFVKVKGHNNNTFNEIADAMARGQVEKAKSIM